MNEEEEQLKVNMASHDFYSNRCLEAEQELVDLLESIADDGELDEGVGKNVVRKGRAYLNLSIKFQQELDRMEQFAPKLMETGILDSKTDIDIFENYIYNLNGTREAQKQVHKTIEFKINLVEKLINENGYGSYE